MRLIKYLQVGGTVKERERYIWDRLIGAGLSKVQSASILGNLKQENNTFDPARKNEQGTGALGVAQWLGDRKNKLLRTKQNALTLEAQVDFLIDEIFKDSHFGDSWAGDQKARTAFLGSTDLGEATTLFSDKFERAGAHEKNNQKRVEYAKGYYSTLGGETHTPPKTSSRTLKWNNPYNKNISDLHSNLTSYFKTLPTHIWERLVVTSTDGGKHAKNSAHYRNQAIDFGYDQEVWDYVANDPNRLKYNVNLIDPNHGTAPHFHFSTGSPADQENDVFKGDKSSFKMYSYASPEFEIHANMISSGVTGGEYNMPYIDEASMEKYYADNNFQNQMRDIHYERFNTYGDYDVNGEFQPLKEEKEEKKETTEPELSDVQKELIRRDNERKLALSMIPTHQSIV